MQRLNLCLPPTQLKDSFSRDILRPSLLCLGGPGKNAVYSGLAALWLGDMDFWQQINITVATGFDKNLQETKWSGQYLKPVNLFTDIKSIINENLTFYSFEAKLQTLTLLLSVLDRSISTIKPRTLQKVKDKHEILDIFWNCPLTYCHLSPKYTLLYEGYLENTCQITTKLWKTTPKLHLDQR